MASTYPGTLDSFSNPVGTNTLDSPDHAQQHSDVNDAVEAGQAVLGTTAGTSVLKNFAAGDFPARINASNVLQQTIQGTINSSTLGTPTVTGGTLNTVTLGTPTATGGTFNASTIGTPAVTGGTITSSTVDTPIVRNYSGWQEANETWTYSGVDDPTGTITVAADVTTKYSNGMRVKFTNGGNVIYGLLTKVSESGGTTTITFLHEIDPTDSLAKVLMANSAITSNYFSNQKVPHGFPIESEKWTVYVKDTTGRTQSSPTTNTWYNINSTLINVPIGSWILSYKVAPYTVKGSATAVNTQVTLSTANNSASDGDFTCWSEITVAATAISANTYALLTLFISKGLSVTAKTPYYLNTRSLTASVTTLGNANDVSPLVLKAVSSYI